MKQKLAHAIVAYRTVIMVILLVIAAWSVTMINKTTINYDLNRYLDQETMTQRALTVMEEEFGSSEQLRLMFIDIDSSMLDHIVAAISDCPEVNVASHNPETDVKAQDGSTYYLVSLILNECDASQFVTDLRAMFPEAGTYYVGGTAATLLDAQHSVAEEMPQVMGIALIVVLGVLLLTSHAWLDPFVILFVLGISIVINMGTNFIFRDVSFITFAVSAVLQLALSIDYAIMLLHTYNDIRDSGIEAMLAMESSLAQCFMRISSSALTTAAGLLSLLFMSFTIGFDIGMVLIKGILISMLCVFLLMPSVVLLMEKPLQRTRHKALHFGGNRLGNLVFGIRKPTAVILAVAVLFGAYLTATNTYIFTEPNNTTKNQTTQVNKVFGSTNPLVILVPGGTEDADYDNQRNLAESLKNLTMDNGEASIGSITAMVTTGKDALAYYSAKDVAELTGMSSFAIKLFFTAQGFEDTVRADKLLAAASELAPDNEAVIELKEQLDSAQALFNGPHYTRMLLDLKFTTTDPDFNTYMDAIFACIQNVYGQDYYITGIPMSNYDISHAFQSDLLKVNIITLVSILLIVMIAFRALLLPLILVFVIEGAIWITMGISNIIHENIFFISYLICVSIQMGATIDYGILLSDQYRALRHNGLEIKAALGEAYNKSIPTILTSGLILTTAGFIIGSVCTIYYISSIGMLISRGAFVSAVLVLTLLPALLTICDRFVVRPKNKE